MNHTDCLANVLTIETAAKDQRNAGVARSCQLPIPALAGAAPKLRVMRVEQVLINVMKAL